MEYKNFQQGISRKGIELKKVDVFGNVCGEFVEFTVTHEYENKSSKDVEGVYTFLIPETAVISGFEVNVGGRVIKGKVEDKKEIEKLYSNLEETDDNKISLEELNNERLKMSIGTIVKGEKATIKISYIEELVYEDSKLKLVIPKVVLPVEDLGASENNEKEYDLSLNLLVETFEDTEFYCDTHKITLEEGENNLYKVTLKDDVQSLENDMIIYLKENISETGGIVYENYEEENGIVYLRFLPDIEEDSTVKKENYTFLLDISDSMIGNKINEAKTALQLCLRNLNEEDTFNIVAMGVKLNYFSEVGKVKFNEETLKAASKWIDNLTCEEDAAIFDGIKYSFSQEEKGIENNIILFTDDIVDDEKEVLDYVEENCNESRIFPFGIDASVNTYFINRIARLTFGRAEFINEKARIEDIVLRQFTRIKGMQLTDISIDWGNMEVEKTYPRTIEYMYDGEAFSIFARVSGELEGIVTLTGEVHGRRVQRRIALTKLDLAVNADLIEKVWYKKRIESLQNRIVYERGEVEEAMRNKIIQLSTDSGIVSDETSFILIEEIYEPVLGVVVRNFLPVKINDEKPEEVNVAKLYYSQSLEELKLEEDLEDDNIDKGEFLRAIATQQLAGGAFSESLDDTVEEKLLDTAKCLLVFVKVAKTMDIYKNLLYKATNYLLENYKSGAENIEVIGTIYIALKGYEKRINVKDSKKAKFGEVLSVIERLLQDENVEIDEIETKVISDIEEDRLQSQLNKLVYSAIK